MALVATYVKLYVHCSRRLAALRRQLGDCVIGNMCMSLVAFFSSAHPTEFTLPCRSKLLRRDSPMVGRVHRVNINSRGRCLGCSGRTHLYNPHPAVRQWYAREPDYWLFANFNALSRLLSGIPLLEQSMDDRYGDRPEYVKYINSTSPLVPLPRSLYGRLPRGVKVALLCEYPLYRTPNGPDVGPINDSLP